MIPNGVKEYLSSNASNILLDGYLRLLGDNESLKYETVLKEWDKWEGGSPFAITAFGDVLVWSDNYIYMYKLAENSVNIILSGFDFFFSNINDLEYQKDYFELELFNRCKESLGMLAEDELYTFNPIPALGGSKTKDTADKGKAFEYLNLIISML